MRGVVYCAVGARYADECRGSLASLIETNPSERITVFTDSAETFSGVSSEMLQVRQHENPTFSFFDKISAIRNSPYDETLFLDADTFVYSPLDSLFEILRAFELGVACETYAPRRRGCAPQSFPEFNTGVIVLRSQEPSVASFLDDWSALGAKMRSLPDPPKHDQPAFREALYSSRVRFCPIPSDWNFHTSHPALLNAGASVKIVHTRIPREKISGEISDRAKHSRVFLPNLACLHGSRIGFAKSGWGWLMFLLCLPARAINWLLQKVCWRPLADE